MPPANSFGPQHVLPYESYPSSTLHYYYPRPHHPPNYAHISSPLQTFQPHLPLPSASQSHIPSLRRTTSVPVPDNIHTAPFPPHSPFDQRKNVHSRTSQRIQSRTSQHIQSLSPIILKEPQPLPTAFNAPSPIQMPNNVIPSPQLHFHRPRVVRTTIDPLQQPLQHATSSPSSSLPSTKDVPILTGKHDWGPWHSAVRTLILNANLLGHIADDPLPNAVFDPGLWPTYPPSVTQRSSPVEIQSFTDWWSRDGVASHILTSRLSTSVLGCLPIANERMGHRRSARTVYFTLRQQYGAGDYSAVMIIEAKLRQLRCLPARGGVRVAEFITTWRTSVNQMEAAGFLPGIRQLLVIFADGLPNNTVAFINLYDSILTSLNEPYEHSLPNIHYLFDCTIHIENNIQRNRILHPNARRLQPTSSHIPSNQTSVGTTSSTPQTTRPTPPGTTTQCSNCHRDGNTLHCSNCHRDGHTDRTCFQPGGAMEGRRDEYLANRVPKPIAHIAEVEENQPDIEESTGNEEEDTLNNEFAAMSLGVSNNIQYSTYALSSFSKMPTDRPTLCIKFNLAGIQYSP